MVRNRFLTLLLACAGAAGYMRGTAIVAGLEDNPGSSGYERNGDFNDTIFELTGNFTILAPGGVFSSLTAGVVNQNGTVFWDNPSIDGADMNAGYLLLDNPAFKNLEYLATPQGGSVNVTFDAAGPVTLTYLGGITANIQLNTLGWYNTSSPDIDHPLVAWPDSPGESVTFYPDGQFALYSSDGRGQVYSSMAPLNIEESGMQQHFAFFEPCCWPPPQVPEASTAALTGIGVALLGLGMVPRRKQ